jgi:hypothetical protein
MEHDDPSEVMENCLIEAGPTREKALAALTAFVTSVGDDINNYFVVTRNLAE